MSERSQHNCCYWLIDTRKIWDGVKIDDAAPDILANLSEQDVAKARRFVFLKDAKLSVASSLLKRLFASKVLGIIWSKVEVGRAVDATHGKPCIVLPSRAENLRTEPSHSPASALSSLRQEVIDFNITHQAGLVALAGFRTAGEPIVTSVGVDIVCVNERNTPDEVKTTSDFVRWIDMHAEVFSEEDVVAMKAPVFASQNSTLIKDARILGSEEAQILMRRFYAFWALKEAYVKMEGEALLADWLQHVEFRNVRVPAPPPKLDSAQTPPEQWGETVAGIEAWFYGKKRENVEIFLQAFDENYMIATAFVRASRPKGDEGKRSIATPEYQVLDLHRDILPFAI